MDDLISRQAAIDAVAEGLKRTFVEYRDAAEKMLNKVTSAQPEPEDWEWCHDCKEYDHELHCCHRWNKVIKETVEELKQAQPEQQWIPVTERLPEYDKPVLLSTAWCKTEIGFWTQRGWMIVACSYREFEQGAVTAWMPLPEPARLEK